MVEQSVPGRAVQAAREAAGLTLEQVSERTKIRVVVLRDLEQGSTTRSGGDAYARGHLRAIARVTGIEPDLLLQAHAQQLDAQARPVANQPVVSPVAEPFAVCTASQRGPSHQGPPHQGPPQQGSPRQGSSHQGSPNQGSLQQPALHLPAAARERSGPRWGLAAAGAAAVLSALLLLGSLTGGHAPDDTALPAPHPAPSVAPAAPLSKAAPVAPTAGVALRLVVAGGASWVRVLTGGGRELFRGQLDAGTAREFSDPAQLQVTLGNAGAVTVGCGGTDVAAGRRGQVRRFTCAPDGLAPA